MSDLEEPKSGISRRTVTKAMAWSVPAVALAVPTPAYAASPGIITLTGEGCKLPGASQDVFKGYAFGAVISNTNNFAINITITDITLNGEDLGDVTVVSFTPCTDLGNPFSVPANTMNLEVAIVTENAASSSNGQLIVTFTVDGGAPQVASTGVNAAPPIQGASCTAFSDAEADCIVSIAA